MGSGQQEAAILTQRFGLKPREVRVLLSLYRSAPNFLAPALLASALSTPSHQNLLAAIYNAKKRVGPDAIEGIRGAGYRLTPAGKALLDQAFLCTA